MLTFAYKDFDVEEPVGEPPRLVFKITVTKKAKNNVYVPPLCFDVNLLSIERRDPAGSYGSDGWLGRSESKPLFLIRDAVDLELSIPINSPKLEKMLDVRQRNRLVGFQILCSGIAFRCELIAGTDTFSLYLPNPIEVMVDYTVAGKTFDRIVFSTDDFDRLLEKLKHYELLRLEIPVREAKSSGQKDLNGALKELDSAKGKLIHGNYQGAMLNIRNALFNHLLEEKKDEGQADKEKVLRQDIKQFVLESIPTESKSIYKEVIDHYDRALRRVRHALGKFVHEDSDRLRIAPLRQDVELSYFMTLFVVRYLMQQID